jgi:hypothetical protein
MQISSYFSSNPKMKLKFLLLIPPLSPISSADFAELCYNSPLPTLPTSVLTENRTVPWGHPSFTLPNGTLCCTSLNQIRDGIDSIDHQVLPYLLSLVILPTKSQHGSSNSWPKKQLTSEKQHVLKPQLNQSMSQPETSK